MLNLIADQIPLSGPLGILLRYQHQGVACDPNIVQHQMKDPLTFRISHSSNLIGLTFTLLRFMRSFFYIYFFDNDGRLVLPISAI